MNDRVLDYSRGRGLGGSTAINFAAYTVGPKDDYDRWAELVDDESFNWENSVKRRKTFENYQFDVKDKSYEAYWRPERSLHGEKGELHVGVPDVWENSMTTLMDAAQEAGLGVNKDINDGVAFGMAAVPATATRDGRRETAATAFLKNVPNNLEIVSETIVQKVLFEGTRAVGVLTNNGECKSLLFPSISVHSSSSQSSARNVSSTHDKNISSVHDIQHHLTHQPQTAHPRKSSSPPAQSTPPNSSFSPA